jgi:molybdopterin-biosynthesis enzyme MoeA-like protein
VKPPRVDVVCIGTELLTGKVNTHTAYLGPALASMGLEIAREQTVGDDPRDMEAAFRTAWNASDIVIACGGLGPTFDDITRDGRVNQLSGQSQNDWPNSFRTARFIPAVEYIRAQRARTLLMREMDKLMANWDVFVTPAPGSASLLVTNLTGHPAVVTPCGFINKLPQAIM